MGHNKDNVVAGLINERDLNRIREAVCVQTEKVYDSCREKDCIENAKVLFKCPEKVQKIINKAVGVKAKKAEVVHVSVDVEEVPFKNGFFTLDVRYFIKVCLEFLVPIPGGGIKTCPKTGVVIFNKKIVLFGSDGNVKIFKSKFVENCDCTRSAPTLEQSNLPSAKIEVAEPIVLNANIQDLLDKLFEDCCCCDDVVPGFVSEALGDDGDDAILDVLEEDRQGAQIPLKRVVVSLGLFSIIKLVRLVQLLIPAFDFCVPHKECIASTDENPCELFETIEFPVNEFFPPQIFDFPGATEVETQMVEEIVEQHKHHGR